MVVRIELSCEQCGATVKRTEADERARKKRNAPGPFCSRECSGNYTRRDKKPTLVTVTCPQCDTEFEVLARRVRYSEKNNAAGPFCSRSCSGTFNSQKQFA